MSNISTQGRIKGIKHLIDDAINYYRICKQKSYNGNMLRLNMGCDIYPRQKNFWDFEADKTTTAIDRYIYEIAVYDGLAAREVEAEARKRLGDIDYQCDSYRWEEEKRTGKRQNEDGKKRSDISETQETEWNVEDYAVGIEYLASLRE